MKSKLRIGNVVAIKQENREPIIIEVTALTSNCCFGNAAIDNKIVEQMCAYEDLVGVKIDDVTLKLFGFTVLQTVDNTVWVKVGFMLLNGRLKNTTMSKPVEYVHELQNLYLDLKGESLLFNIELRRI